MINVNEADFICCVHYFSGERTGEAAHRLIQLFHQCRGRLSWGGERVVLSIQKRPWFHFVLFLLQIKKIMKANEKVTSDADPMWYLK